MAIDPRISLAVASPTLTPAVNAFENALMNSQTRDMRQQQMAQAAIVNPLIAQQQQIATEQARQNQRIGNTALTAQQMRPLLVEGIQSGDTARAEAFLTRNLTDIQARQAAGEDIDADETIEALELLKSGGAKQLLSDSDGLIQIARDRGLLNSNISMQQRRHNQLVSVVENDPELKTTQGKAAAIELGLQPRASTSAQERIAGDPNLAQDVAETQALIKSTEATATEGAKLTQQLRHKPEITKAVKLAEKEATERGEVLTALNRSKAALPGLKSAVNELKELAPIATSTLGGKVFDQAVKQSGFGSTKGANARAKFVAIVNNQVLPLLKETFGAAFTAQEGEALKATMGDPDASPQEKMVQLEAFMAQKVRDIETREQQLSSMNNESSADTGKVMVDANGNRARVFADGTFEELP